MAGIYQDHELPYNDALRAIDALDLSTYHQLLIDQPALLTTPREGGEGYFANPYLLYYFAENPIRNGKLEPSIIGFVALHLELLQSTQHESIQKQLTHTLALVASGRVPRESGVQRDLLRILSRFGANVDEGIQPAIAHNEMEAMEELCQLGAKTSLLIATARNDHNQMSQSWDGATNSEKRVSLAAAAYLGNASALQFLISKKSDPNGYLPEGFHPHSTALHQAALTGSLPCVEILLDAGADTTIPDKIYQGTPADWAKHAGHLHLDAILAPSKNTDTDH